MSYPAESKQTGPMHNRRRFGSVEV